MGKLKLPNLIQTGPSFALEIAFYKLNLPVIVSISANQETSMKHELLSFVKRINVKKILNYHPT